MKKFNARKPRKKWLGERNSKRCRTESRLSWDVEGARMLCLYRSPGGKCVTGGAVEFIVTLLEAQQRYS